MYQGRYRRKVVVDRVDPAIRGHPGQSGLPDYLVVVGWAAASQNASSASGQTDRRIPSARPRHMRTDSPRL